MKLKKKVQKALDIEDYETLAHYGGGSDGFWYDLVYGGYFKPEEVLADKADVKRVNAALEVLKEFEQVYEQLTEGS